MHADEAIVITGMGLATSLGLTPEETFDAALAGRCGVGPMSALEQRPALDKGGGQAMPLPGGDGTPREVAYLRHVIARALHGAGPHAYSVERTAIVLGTTLHGMRAAGRTLRSGDLTELRAFTAGAVASGAIEGLPIGGGSVSTCSACSSGLGAVAIGVTMLRAGASDMVIAGGYDAVSEYAYAGFDSLRLVASGPARPFGAGREGMKTAEGYGVVVLERAGDAEARGASIRGFVAGIGESADAHHLTQPHPEGRGAVAAMRAALEAAGMAPGEIGLISTHATATPNNDAAEYAALEAVFGEGLGEVPVVAFKSHLGHTLGGAGAVELVLAVLARERGIVPPTVNGGEIDTAFTRLRLGTGHAAPASIPATINLSLGFGGANTCVVVSSRRGRVRPRTADEPVITGVGVVLPGAVGNRAFAALMERGPMASGPCAGPIAEDEIAHLVNARRVRRMSEYVKLTLAAAGEACAHAKIEGGALEGGNAILGTMHGSAGFCESYYGQIVREGLSAANPTLFAEGVPNAASAHLSMALGLTGGCQTIIGSRTAGLDALRLAAMRIREGAWSLALVGAAEEHCGMVRRAHRAIEPDGAAELAAGSVMFVVEARRAAEARGAKVLAVIGEGGGAIGSPDGAAQALSEWQGGAPVISALGRSSIDRLFRRGAARAGRAHWSISELVPEVLSAGPLAALAAAILAPGAVRPQISRPGGALVVLAADPCVGAAALPVTVE